MKDYAEITDDCHGMVGQLVLQIVRIQYILCPTVTVHIY